jgi:phosphoglycerol transferase MdoB-like AlkP superfamily enzyme
MLVVELLQSGEHVSRLISLSTMMHAGRYNLPAINPEKHASSGYKKLEERRTTKKKKEETGRESEQDKRESGEQHERETETSKRKECKKRKSLRLEPALPSSSSFQKPETKKKKSANKN